MKMGKRRRKRELRADVVNYCKTPQFLSDILMKVNLNHRQFMKLVKLGLVRKYDESKNSWTGPPAHRYIATENVLR